MSNKTRPLGLITQTTPIISFLFVIIHIDLEICIYVYRVNRSPSFLFVFMIHYFAYDIQFSELTCLGVGVRDYDLLLKLTTGEGRKCNRVQTDRSFFGR